MSTPDETPEAPEPQFDAAPLSRWERSAASLLGLALSGAGAAAVFKTSNQAGSVALLLVGVVLLIMAVNGSPLTRARYQDYELFMARRRRPILANIDQEAPEVARQTLQVLNTVDPGASRDPLVAQVSAHVYEREVVDRLAGKYPSMVVTRGPMDMGMDAVIPLEYGRIGVEVKAGQTPLSGRDLRNAVERVSRVGHSSAQNGVDALLLVTNRPLPADFSRRIREVRSVLPIAVVRWVDEQDDQALTGKIDDLALQLGASR
ncbi:hypothetical protein ACFVY1_00615 [Streptomyces sp. NPDC058293]|uniref:hypothetical protein n=1 Tax=Streptomyces sp. NPDC058293 TaxID=3346429 RepID=UPI0036EF3BD3